MISISPRASRPGLGRNFVHGLAACLAATLVLFVAGCHPAVTDPQDPRFIVAEKANWTITRGQLNNEIATFFKESHKTAADIGPAKMPLLEMSMLRFMVLKKLLLEKAATLQLKDVDKDEHAALQQLQDRYPTEADFESRLKASGMTLDELKKQIHEQVVLRKTLEIVALQNVEPTDKEIDDFYLQHKDKFVIPDKVRASRVVVLLAQNSTPAEKAAKKKAIDKAHARVVKGEDFSKVATEVSEDRYSAPKGGDVGYFQRGENEPEFDAVAFSTKEGTVSPVFESPMGYEFLKVTDVHPGGEVSIAEARDTIANYLLKEKSVQEEQSYSEKLLADSGVTFHLAAPNPAGDTNAAPLSPNNSPATNAPPP